MLRVVTTVLKFLFKQMKGLPETVNPDSAFEQMKAQKQIVFETW